MITTTIDLKAMEDFWYWINERHQIFLNREAGKPKPWTTDKVLQEWKFCNPFRQNDKGTRYLIDNIIKPNQNESPGLMLFNIYAYRAFNLPWTFKQLTNGRDWFNHWNPERYKDWLYVMASSGVTYTSSAYMLRGREGIGKYESIIETLDDIWNAKDYHTAHIMNAFEMELVYTELMASKYWGWGPFTTYQVVLDLTYSPLLEAPNDINTWCVLGPGAKRGIREIFPELNKLDDQLEATRYLWSIQGAWLKDYMPIMTLQDIEFSLCELSKYRRIKAGGKGKQKYAGI